MLKKILIAIQPDVSLHHNLQVQTENINKVTSCLVGLPFFLCPESNFFESYEHFIVLNRKRLNPK